MIKKNKKIHKDHYARCGYCGWFGLEIELSQKSGHPCGDDKCPECGKENFITCCLKEE